MFGWKTLLVWLLPMLETLGFAKINEDENDTGTDDIIGQSILFGVRIFRAILAGDTAKLNKLLPEEAKTKTVTKDSFKPPTHFVDQDSK